MDFTNMNFIQMNFYNGHLFALMKEQNKNKYAVLTGKIKKPKLDVEEIQFQSWLTDRIIPVQYGAHIDLVFLEKQFDGSLFHIITLNNRDEYDTILKVVEVLL